jgi:hypothetical protein
VSVTTLHTYNDLVVLLEHTRIDEGACHITVFREGEDDALVLTPDEAAQIGLALYTAGATIPTVIAALD